MNTTVKTHVNIRGIRLKKKLDLLINDPATMLEIHNLFAKMCDPYVPMQEGVLAQTLNITPEYVQYTQPYAHYQYTGEVYGPNYPIKEDGIIVGWFSPPEKSPTGRSINYSKERHPLATKEWDKAMLADHRREFISEVKKILKRRAKQLG